MATTVETLRARTMLKVTIFFWIITSVIVIYSEAQAGKSEADYVDEWCIGEIEAKIDGGRIDCLTTIYAIEADFAYKWAEAIGQSLFYAYKTNRRPGIALIVYSERHCKHVEKLRDAIQNVPRIEVFLIGPKALTCEILL